MLAIIITDALVGESETDGFPVTSSTERSAETQSASEASVLEIRKGVDEMPARTVSQITTVFVPEGVDVMPATTLAQTSTSFDAKNETSTSFDAKNETSTSETIVTVEAKEEAKEVKLVNYFALYRFADPLDKLLIFVGVLCSLAHGTLTPMFSILFGKILDGFNAAKPDTLVQNVNFAVLWLTYIGILAFVTSYAQVACFVAASQRQCTRIRRSYFRALLCQEMGWYDNQTTGALSARIQEDVSKIQDAIGDKVGSCLQFLSMFITGFIVGFIYGWKLAFVIISVAPLLGVTGAWMAKGSFLLL